MDLFEHEAKQLFGEHGVPVAEGQLSSTPEQAHRTAERLGGRVVVKAQVKIGGRGKAGGVKVADDPADAQAKAEEILGMDIKGHTTRAVLVEEASAIAEEYYLAYLLDRANRTFLAIASVQGGMDIEEVARTDPDAVARVPIDPAIGVDGPTADLIIERAGFPEHARAGLRAVLRRLWDVASAEDAVLVEVNPLARTDAGRVIALDGKVTLDDNAFFRHPERTPFRDDDQSDPLEVRAKEKGLNYVKLDGQVGIIGNGAGLV
ncbi:succinyl-CoA synthetase beta subunit, partial [Murinocardiopsis flavida]